MNRRAFLKTAFIFTGALWVPKTGILRQAEARMNMGIVGGGTAAAAAGGPDTYYYGSGLATGDYTNDAGWSTDSAVGDDITIIQAGTITKMGVKLGSTKGTGDIKLILVTGTTTIYECGTILNASLTINVWNDFTLVSPMAASASQVIKVLVANSALIDYLYAGVTGGLWRGETSNTYLNFCTTYPTGVADDYQVGVRVYVD